MLQADRLLNRLQRPQKNASWGCVLQVEFNKAALSLSDAIPTDQRKAALNRLLKARAACPLLLLAVLSVSC